MGWNAVVTKAYMLSPPRTNHGKGKPRHVYSLYLHKKEKRISTLKQHKYTLRISEGHKIIFIPNVYYVDPGC